METELIAYFRAPTTAARKEWLTTWLDRLEPEPGEDYYHDCYGAMDDDVDDATAIMNLLGYLHLKYHRSVYECTNCGLLWIEDRGSKRLQGYAPENGQYNEALDSEKVQQGIHRVVNGLQE